MKTVVSACLLGENCKYNGKNNRNEAVLEFVKDREVLPLCPELLSGLGSPRPKAELKDGIAYNEFGENIHDRFAEGVRKAMEAVAKEDVDLAVLQSRSPTCGVNQIYDGTFSGTKITGQGLFAKALKEAGITLIDAEDLGCKPGAEPN